MANTLQIRRGAFANLPTLAAGEPGFCNDAALQKRFFVGDGTVNREVLMYELFNANTILAATTDNTPVALTVAASRIVGRKATGDIGALTAAEILAIIGVESGADVTDATNVNAAGAVMEADYNANTFLYAATDDTPVAKTCAEVMALLSGQADDNFAMNSQRITGGADPVDAQDFATKAFVEALAQGINPIQQTCHAATTAALPNCTYANGASGVGATLTGDANGALAAQDGQTLSVDEYLLVKNQAAGLQNGMYKLTTVGDGANPFVLTRHTEMDEDAEVANAFIFVSAGTDNADIGFVCTNEPEAVDVGVDAITFAHWTHAGHITAGAGLTKTGNTLSVDGVLEDLDALGACAVNSEFLVGTGAGTLAWETGDIVRTSLGLAIGTNVQAYDPELAALADLTSAANKIPYFTGSETAGLFDFVTTVDDPGLDTEIASAKAVRTALGAVGGAAANTALSNLAAVAINAALIPGTAGALDVGSTTKPWGDIWWAGTSDTPATNQFKFTGTSTGGVRTITFPDASGTVLLDGSTIDCGSF